MRFKIKRLQHRIPSRPPKRIRSIQLMQKKRPHQPKKIKRPCRLMTRLRTIRSSKQLRKQIRNPAPKKLIQKRTPRKQRLLTKLTLLRLVTTLILPRLTTLILPILMKKLIQLRLMIRLKKKQLMIHKPKSRQMMILRIRKTLTKIRLPMSNQPKILTKRKSRPQLLTLRILPNKILLNQTRLLTLQIQTKLPLTLTSNPLIILAADIVATSLQLSPFWWLFLPSGTAKEWAETMMVARMDLRGWTECFDRSKDVKGRNAVV